MTKSRAYELSQEHAKEVARKLWLDKEITTNAVSFLAGMKAMLMEAGQWLVDEETNLDNPKRPTATQLFDHLRKLMEINLGEQDG